jgi:N-acetylmuramoyl-L-alanine amidase
MDKVDLVVTSGHGGADPGALSKDRKVQEKDLNIIFSRKFGAVMQRKYPGLNVVLMDKDETLSAKEECDWVKHYDPKLCLAFHNNAGGGSGCEVIHSIKSDGMLAKSIGSALSRTGMPLRRTFSRESEKQAGRDYYYIIRDVAPVESIIIEFGFVDSDADLAKLRDEAAQQRMVEAVADVVAVYLTAKVDKPAPAKPVTAEPVKIICEIDEEKTELAGVVADGISYIPVRYLKNLGCEVGWDGKAVTVKIKGG